MGRALLLGLIFVTSQAATALTAVLATTSIVAALGRAPLLAIWALRAALTIVWATGSGSIIARGGARRMLVGGLFATAVSYAVISFVVGAQTYGPLALALLVVIDDAQMNGLYHAAWGVAREQMSSDETLRYFGRIAAMCTAGAVSGTAAAGLVLRYGFPAGRVLGALAATFAIVGVVVSLVAQGPASNSMRPFVSGRERRAKLGGALRFVRTSPPLRSVAILSIANGVGYTIIDYEVIRMLAGSADFGVRYAGLMAIEPIFQVVAEAAVAPWAVRRFGPRVAFVTPVVILLDVALLALAPSVVSAFAAVIALHSAFGIETLARSYVVSRAPARVRQGIGVLNDGAYYPTGYILACIAIGSTVLGGATLGVAEMHLRAVWLGVGAVTVAVAAFAGRHLYHTCADEPDAAAPTVELAGHSRRPDA